MSVISKVKQNIRDYLTTKYDAMYFQELESQITSYDDWIWEQNNSKEEVTEELILDLGKKEKDKQQKRNLVTKISYGQLGSWEELVPEAGEDTVVKKGTLITKIWED